jgi:hypothetical protein
MATEIVDSIPAEVVEQISEAIRIAYSNVRDPEAMKKAAEWMDHRAEKNARIYGIHNAAVDIVREMRDSR